MGTFISILSKASELGTNPSVSILKLFVSAFNYSLHLSVVEFSKLMNVAFVEEAWVMSRDLANIFFIFILLYIAISTIFQLGGVDTKKMLIRVIIVALLVNFSAFGTKVLIDGSNILSLGFYNQIEVPVDNNGYKNIGSVLVDKSRIATALVAGIPGLGAVPGVTFLAGLYDNTSGAIEVATTERTLVDVAFNRAGYYVLFLLLAFTLFTVAYLFMIRSLVLMILLITSPFALLGTIVSPLKGVTSSWVGQIKGQLIWPPIFMFFLFLTMKMINERDSLIQGMGLGDGNRTYEESFTANIAIYFFIVGMLLAGIIIAKKMGAIGSKSGLKLGGGFVFGGAAKLGRGTIGRGAGYFADSKRLKNAAKKSLVAKTTLKTLQKTNKASFDVRASRAGKATLKTAGLDAGNAKTGGYKKYFDDKIKAEQDFAKTLGDQDAQDEYAKNLDKRPGWGFYGKINKEAANKIGNLRNRERIETEIDPEIKTTTKEIGKIEEAVRGFEKALKNIENTYKGDQEAELAGLKSTQKSLESQASLNNEGQDKLAKVTANIVKIEQEKRTKIKDESDKIELKIKETKDNLTAPQEKLKGLKEQKKKLEGGKSVAQEVLEEIKKSGLTIEEPKSEDNKEE